MIHILVQKALFFHNYGGGGCNPGRKGLGSQILGGKDWGSGKSSKVAKDKGGGQKTWGGGEEQKTRGQYSEGQDTGGGGGTKVLSLHKPTVVLIIYRTVNAEVSG